jgi:Lon protease-like protein
MTSYELPLFPLRTVLFPGQTLPLHIFEPRYREMITRCLETDRKFGVVLIREGVEVGGPATPHDVGTIAEIQDVERLPDGRMNIITVGRDRFRVEDYDTSRSYLVGRVTPWPWSAELFQEEALSRAVGRQLDRYLGLFSQASDTDLRVDFPQQHPATLAVMAAIILQVPPEEKQMLLEVPSVDELLRRLDELLRNENRGLQIMLAASHQQQEMDNPFSLN